MYSKVLENAAKTGVLFIFTYNLLWLPYFFKKGRFFSLGRYDRTQRTPLVTSMKNLISVNAKGNRSSFTKMILYSVFLVQFWNI